MNLKNKKKKLKTKRVAGPVTVVALDVALASPSGATREFFLSFFRTGAGLFFLFLKTSKMLALHHFLEKEVEKKRREKLSIELRGSHKKEKSNKKTLSLS